MKQSSAVIKLGFFAVIAFLGMGLSLWPSEAALHQGYGQQDLAQSVEGQFSSLTNAMSKNHESSVFQTSFPGALAQQVSDESGKKLITKKIEDIRLGQRIVGRNPIREQAELIEPEPKNWRLISLHMWKSDGLSFLD